MMTETKITLSEARRRIRQCLQAAPLEGETPEAYLARQVRQLKLGYSLDNRELAELIGDHPANVSRALSGRLGRRKKILERLERAGVRRHPEET